MPRSVATARQHSTMAVTLPETSLRLPSRPSEWAIANSFQEVPAVPEIQRTPRVHGQRSDLSVTSLGSRSTPRHRYGRASPTDRLRRCADPPPAESRGARRRRYARLAMAGGAHTCALRSRRNGSPPCIAARIGCRATGAPGSQGPAGAAERRLRARCVHLWEMCPATRQSLSLRLQHVFTSVYH